MKINHKVIFLGLTFLVFLVTYSCQNQKGLSSDDNNMLLGNPSNATHDTTNSDNYLIDHKFYIESYNKTKGEPNWVSWHISSRDLGDVDRLNDFRPDSINLPKSWYEANNTSYRGSGFDKGHNCPSGDRTSSTYANSTTFLMDNIIPQAPNNNRHTWEHLENFCRQQVRKGNEAYIIMGSYGSGGIGKLGFKATIADQHIRVPSYIWKIVLIMPDGDDDIERLNSNTQIIAVDTPNDNSISSNWIAYLCTVRDIEKATGYIFFSNLPDKLKSDLENRKVTARY